MAAGLTGDGRVAVVALPTSAPGLFYIDEDANSIGVEKWNAPVNLGMPSGASSFVFLTMAYDAGGRH